MQTSKLITLLNEDCRGVDIDGVTAIVTDPPYGLEFMGEGWDKGVPGVDFWKHFLDMCLPGAMLVSFGGTRTYHRMVCAIEDAGWTIRDCVMWLYGSGFPKSHNISKGIDKAAGATREVVGHQRLTGNACVPTKDKGGTYGVNVGVVPPQEIDITAPATEDAKKWNGYGTVLKPAYEPICIAMKPLDGTFVNNALAHGVAGINVDGCRVGVEKRVNASMGTPENCYGGYTAKNPIANIVQGRWPANVIHDGSDEVVEGFPNTSPSKRQVDQSLMETSIFVANQYKRGESHDDNGGSASRFFYCAKVGDMERGWWN